MITEPPAIELADAAATALRFIFFSLPQDATAARYSLCYDCSIVCPSVASRVNVSKRPNFN